MLQADVGYASAQRALPPAARAIPPKSAVVAHGIAGAGSPDTIRHTTDALGQLITRASTRAPQALPAGAKRPVFPMNSDSFASVLQPNLYGAFLASSVALVVALHSVAGGFQPAIESEP
jgi:hypothetical protein